MASDLFKLMPIYSYSCQNRITQAVGFILLVGFVRLVIYIKNYLLRVAMFADENISEGQVEIENYHFNETYLQQSFFNQQSASPKDKNTTLATTGSYLNQLLQETVFSPQKENSKRITQNKLKYKKLKQKLNLLTELLQDQGLFKEQKDTNSPNKSRLLKLALQLQKSLQTQAIDYQLLQSILKQIHKIVEHKRDHDILILKGARLMNTLNAIIKRFPSLHRTEATQATHSVDLALRLLKIMLTLVTNRELLLVSNQMIPIITLLNCVLMRQQKKLLTHCFSILNLMIAGPQKSQLNQILRTNLEYLLCSSLLKRLKGYLQNCIIQDDPIYSQFILLGFKFYYLLMRSCCQKQLERPIYGTPVMDNLSRAVSCYFEMGIQHLSFSITQLIFQKESEGQNKQLYCQDQIPTFKINALLYIFKSLNIIFHVNVGFAQKVISCNNWFLKAVLFTFNYAKQYFKESYQIKNLCNQIIIFIGNLSSENEQMQNMLRQCGLLASFSNHPLEYMMDPLKHIFVPAYCSLIFQNSKNIEEAFKESSVLTLLQYIQKQISSKSEKRLQEQPYSQQSFCCSNNQCRALSRKTSVSSMNSNYSSYSKTSMAQSYTTQNSTQTVNYKNFRLQYKFRVEFWQQLAKQLQKIDD